MMIRERKRLIACAQVGEKLMQMGSKKSKRLSEEEMGKRQPYGFGLGRAPAIFTFISVGKGRFSFVTPHIFTMCAFYEDIW